jgi:hypothetical protein
MVLDGMIDPIAATGGTASGLAAGLGATDEVFEISRIGGAPVGWGAGAACASWPTRDTNRYTGPWNATTPNPILLLSSRYEPNMPLTVARKVERLLGNAVLLVHDGYGHPSVNDPSICVTRPTGSYLVGLVTPRADTVCPFDRRPFDPQFGQP